MSNIEQATSMSQVEQAIVLAERLTNNYITNHGGFLPVKMSRLVKGVGNLRLRYRKLDNVAYSIAYSQKKNVCTISVNNNFSDDHRRIVVAYALAEAILKGENITDGKAITAFIHEILMPRKLFLFLVAMHNDDDELAYAFRLSKNAISARKAELVDVE